MKKVIFLFTGYWLFVAVAFELRKLTMEKGWFYDPWFLGPCATFFLTTGIPFSAWLLFLFETAIFLTLVYFGITSTRLKFIWIIAAILVWLASGFLPHALLM